MAVLVNQMVESTIAASLKSSSNPVGTVSRASVMSFQSPFSDHILRNIPVSAISVLSGSATTPDPSNTSAVASADNDTAATSSDAVVYMGISMISVPSASTMPMELDTRSFSSESTLLSILLPSLSTSVPHKSGCCHARSSVMDQAFLPLRIVSASASPTITSSPKGVSWAGTKLGSILAQGMLNSSSHPPVTSACAMVIPEAALSMVLAEFCPPIFRKAAFLKN